MPHLLNIWPAVSRQLAASPRVLLLFDYDGTLTPIVARPEIAKLPDDTRRLLTNLARIERFVVGVVSGRDLADLEALVGIPGLVYAGNHGLEISGLGMDYVHPEAPGFVESMAEIAQSLERELNGVPKSLVHNKGLTISVHFRNTPESFSDQVDSTVVSVVQPNADAGRMKITRGKKVVEVRPNLDWGKGEAIAQIRENCGDSPLPVFFGDDQTDEDGFVVVQDAGGIAVYVGPTRQETKALHQLESPAEVAQTLELLTRLDPA